MESNPPTLSSPWRQAIQDQFGSRRRGSGSSVESGSRGSNTSTESPRARAPSVPTSPTRTRGSSQGALEATATMTASTEQPQPKRGGTNRYGPFVGGGFIGTDHCIPRECLDRYQFYNQVRNNVKGEAIRHSDLTKMEDDPTVKRFSGKKSLTAEELVQSPYEVDLDGFTAILDKKIREHGVEYHFTYVMDDKVYYALRDYHHMTSDMLQKAHVARLQAEDENYSPVDKVNAHKYDDYERESIALSRRLVRMLVTDEVYTKVSNAYGSNDLNNTFDRCPGAVLFMMVIESTSIVMSNNIDEAVKNIKTRKLAKYPGEDVAAFTADTTSDLKVVEQGYAVDIQLSAVICDELMKTSCHGFNLRMMQKGNEVDDFVRTFRHRNPKDAEKDKRWPTHNPSAICRWSTQKYQEYLPDRWPAQQSGDQVNLGDDSDVSGGPKKCPQCGRPHSLDKKCWGKNFENHPGGNRDKGNASSSSSSANQDDGSSDKGIKDSKQTSTTQSQLKALIENMMKMRPPSDNPKMILTTPDGKEWKYCEKCEPDGKWTRSHFTDEHDDDYKQESNSMGCFDFDSYIQDHAERATAMAYQVPTPPKPSSPKNVSSADEENEEYDSDVDLEYVGCMAAVDCRDPCLSCVKTLSTQMMTE
uniref:Uncharacterized protein n=1 Tax=Grammatophora oceanica TaxID=210454 RepID=A0A7S1USA9_9STRA|mmetsp:Transcript_16615/g.24626  ORF Transcript_16615/g.24626 Transcript_16615/m.24626 type:complete len:642 (+) Transcript_16615:162-2087(+)